MPESTARFFDAMAASYDDLEPWYRHLYARLHRALRASLPLAPPGARALDAGCGTGFQTAIVAELGYRAHGLDVSAGGLAVARARVPAARLVRGDVLSLPYRDAAFDAVVCAGSTLDFVDDPVHAIAELARVMRPGGTLFLEVERRFCLDLGWTLLSSLTGDGLAYGLRPAQAWALLARPPREGVWLDYPGYPPLRLFTDHEIRSMLDRAGLRVERAWGIHAVTNLLPSTCSTGPACRPGCGSCTARSVPPTRPSAAGPPPAPSPPTPSCSRARALPVVLCDRPRVPVTSLASEGCQDE